MGLNMPSEEIRILLVDDDEDEYIIMRDLIRDMSSWRFNIDWASDYKTAVSLMCSNQYDLYLVDYLLGIENGLLLANDAIEKGCVNPIILVTGFGSPDLTTQALQVGITGYINKEELNKPRLVETLIDILKSANIKQ